MNARTKGPWDFDWTGNYRKPGTIYRNGINIARVLTSTTLLEPEARANAAFIVEACNAHDALTARVETLVAERDALRVVLEHAWDAAANVLEEPLVGALPTPQCNALLSIVNNARRALGKGTV